MAKYKLLIGRHSGNDINGKPCSWDATDPKNCIVETNDNLDQFNTPGVQPKFEKLSDSPKPMFANPRIHDGFGTGHTVGTGVGTGSDS